MTNSAHHRAGTLPVSAELETDAASEPIPLQPFDEHNRKLMSHVRPADWTNPTPSGRYNLVVLGAGTAGLVTAAGAAGLGAKVALVERELMGGDCLNVGCVPSKGVISAARAAAAVRDAGEFGCGLCGAVEVDAGAHRDRDRAERVGDVVAAGHAQRDSAELRAIERRDEVEGAVLVHAQPFRAPLRVRVHGVAFDAGAGGALAQSGVSVGRVVLISSPYSARANTPTSNPEASGLPSNPK